MFKSIKENLVLKIVSLLVSIAMWLYVTADRIPNSTATRTINAEIVKLGPAPNDVVIRFKADSLPVEIAGPKLEVDGLADNDIKAEVDVRALKVGTSQLKIANYRIPKSTPNVEQKGRQYVVVEVFPKVRKSLAIVPLTAPTATGDQRYVSPKLRPEWITISGAQDDVRRVSRITVALETTGAALSADLPIRAEDRDGVEVTGIELTPSVVHVDMPLDLAPATRRLIVNVPIVGRPAPGFVISEVLIDPSECTVLGPPSALQNMTNISTREVSVDLATTDVVRDVPISLPSGVTALNDRLIVRVTVRIKDIAKAANHQQIAAPGNHKL